MREQSTLRLCIVSSLAWGWISLLSGCTAMAPGIQFNNAPNMELQEQEGGVVTQPIKVITPRALYVNNKSQKILVRYVSLHKFTP
jgi:hypothetical protein